MPDLSLAGPRWSSSSFVYSRKTREQGRHRISLRVLHKTYFYDHASPRRDIHGCSAARLKKVQMQRHDRTEAVASDDNELYTFVNVPPKLLSLT